jgi:hypothetical protein
VVSSGRSTVVRFESAGFSTTSPAPRWPSPSRRLRRCGRPFAASADYIFNTSHASGYGYLTYVTAFLKANWTAEYAAALLSVTDKDDKRQAVLESLRAEGIVRCSSVQATAASTSPRCAVVNIRCGSLWGCAAPRALLARTTNSTTPSPLPLANHRPGIVGAR